MSEKKLSKQDKKLLQQYREKAKPGANLVKQPDWTGVITFIVACGAFFMIYNSAISYIKVINYWNIETNTIAQIHYTRTIAFAGFLIGLLGLFWDITQNINFFEIVDLNENKK